MSAIERATTEVRIGNNGQALAYVNTTNERLIKNALEEFNRGLFDVMGVKRYFNVIGRPVVMDSLRVIGSAIWASIQYPRLQDEYVDPIMEHIWRKGCLFLGADIEFDMRKPISAGCLAYDRAQMEAMAVGEQMTYVKFIMLYYWDDQHKRRDTIYKIPTG